MSKKSTLSFTPANSFIRRVIYFCTPALLPLLLAIIPTLYHYGNNVAKLTLNNLLPILVLNSVIAIVIYIVCLIITRFDAYKAAIAAFIFLIFFNLYGLVYKFLLHRDLFRLEHYTLLPLALMAAVYAIWFVTKLKQSVLITTWKNLTLVIGIMVAWNLVRIAPVEVNKWDTKPATAGPVAQQVSTDKNAPDIYYIILDEFAGFQAMREYWHYQGVDEFAKFLKDKGFFVAEASHGDSKKTLHEVASRLNYREYPVDDKYIQIYVDDIANNRVIQFLKARGYTTVVFNETNFAFYSVKPIQADYVYQYGDSSIPESETKSPDFYLDEFGELVMNNTMYYAVAQTHKYSAPLNSQHNNMINFTVEHLADRSVPSPKFVYVHLLLPHPPFIYDQNGNFIDGHSTDWNYYIDNYIYSISVAREMIGNILQNANKSNPPVIVLQSDHGARNESYGESIFLPDYPEKYKTLILNAMYLPGYDTSKLPQDMNPINTFPIIFNSLFDARIPLVK